MNHSLVGLADRINWEAFEHYWQKQFSTAGWPQAISGRLVSGLLMLRYMEGLSDEQQLRAWVNNPYYPYFCGGVFFQRAPPVDPTSLIRWRQRLGDAGLEWILTMVPDSTVNAGALTRQSMSHLCVDSTVMKKNIAYPTDSQLLEKRRGKLVEFLKSHDPDLRQSYARQGPSVAEQAGRYVRAKQFERMRRQIKKLCPWVGRLSREIERQLGKLSNPKHTAVAVHLVGQAKQLIFQSKIPKSKNKLYSLREPDVDCLSKGNYFANCQRYFFDWSVLI